ncbi:SDR family NAD(P)-dependent oxidoreductase [Vibrio sp. VB16]|uniref:SDR family NAD(P)-dependent oxidoreductase n=1 Tax=Vibrio sp. VB16 TaxID=2785746 RepID=UPI001E4BCEA2|nr:SDR family oxidoreductase [Vibrio sp. VB16]UGA54969.1 SDR family oxidoreductase [Vibrio sp. VB16]
MFDLKEITVLVTGATGYLGKEMCIGLASSGANVLVNSRNEENANRTISELAELGYRAEAAVFDVTDTNSINQFFAQYKGTLAVIINNAYAGKGGTIECSESSDFTNAYKITVESANNLFQAALPLLRASVKRVGYASVVNISSMYGCVAPDLGIYNTAEGTNPPFYGAAKAALIQWSKYGACEFGKENIRFNSISPGPFPNIANNAEPFLNVLANKVPMKRVGSPEEIQGPVVFLASKASSYVNGCNLAVDGGWTAW